MRGIRGEPVEVWLRNGRPARFVWRGRMHTVMFVLDKQVTPASTVADPASTVADPAPAADGPAAGGTGGSECWRVEATPERSVPSATYQLCRDLVSGRWLLSRD
ncbi:MAG TPA: DUF6504 family protein [Streptosporangiaceae bacterium]|nr:DUF6504 family protein [Streptosporangiaceae bacterium]